MQRHSDTHRIRRRETLPTRCGCLQQSAIARVAPNPAGMLAAEFRATAARLALDKRRDGRSDQASPKSKSRSTRRQRVNAGATRRLLGRRSSIRRSPIERAGVCFPPPACLCRWPAETPKSTAGSEAAWQVPQRNSPDVRTPPIRSHQCELTLNVVLLWGRERRPGGSYALPFLRDFAVIDPP